MWEVRSGLIWGPRIGVQPRSLCKGHRGGGVAPPGNRSLLWVPVGAVHSWYVAVYSCTHMTSMFFRNATKIF